MDARAATSRIAKDLISRPFDKPTRVTTRHYVVGPQGQLANVVVYIKSGLLRKYDPVRPAPVLDQIGCMYEPYVLGVVAGQTFQIRNSDPVLHNIHATPKINPVRHWTRPARACGTSAARLVIPTTAREAAIAAWASTPNT